jgi:fluoride exporter
MIAVGLVLVGGALGSVWRYLWSGLIAERFGETFPYGTLIVNLAGSLIIGLGSGYLTRFGSEVWALSMRQFLLVGICGGLTTFSSFSLQTLHLMLSRRWGAAFTNILTSTTLSIGLTAAGWELGRLIPLITK